MTDFIRLLKQPDLFRQECYVGGAWIGADSGERFDVVDPASGKIVATVPDCGKAETRRAVVAAAEAFPAWRGATAAVRGAALRRWFDLMLANCEDLAAIMTAEQGKPLAEAAAEVRYAAGFAEWYAEEAKRVYGEVIPSPFPDRRIVVVREPVGVSAAITPWNFPAAMITRKAAAALAAGCPMVVKPASQTPLTALALAHLADRAGIPAGVFNVLTGDAEAIGGELTANPLVRKLSFTGSTAVGRRLAAQSAPTLKRLSLELGGNAPFIVFDDADIDAAVAGAVASKFRNTGQTCVCANRFLVQETLYEDFARRLAGRVEELRIGGGFDPGVEQGPLIDRRALEHIEELLADAASRGARVLVGGKRYSLGGTFYSPTVLLDVTRDMRVFREEIFGPVAALMPFRDEAEAIALANDTEYGLAAYCYTREAGRAWRVSSALEYGIVGLNTGAISTEVAPFGGIKQSGYGREGARAGLDEYLQTKHISMAGLA